MHLMIFSPGKVSRGVANDDATNEELYKTLYLAATKEQGNGNGKETKRGNGETVDAEIGR